MNELTLNNNLTMTSREIAELAKREHKNVLRDIDNLIESLGSDLSSGFKSSTYRDSNSIERRQFILDRDSSICLVTGYDATARMRIIKRWQELEAQVKVPAPVMIANTPETKAVEMLRCRLTAAELLRVPTHIGEQEAVKEIRKSIGVDYSALLQHAPAQQAIANKDVMLEPIDLAQLMGLPRTKANAHLINIRLLEGGWQVERHNQWVPTEAGKPYCVRHAWSSGAKSGYNLKWQATSVIALFRANPRDKS